MIELPGQNIDLRGYKPIVLDGIIAGLKDRSKAEILASTDT
jgi:hypothetical protein